MYDEDRDKKSEFLGKVAIPILLVRWFNLFDHLQFENGSKII